VSAVGGWVDALESTWVDAVFIGWLVVAGVMSIFGKDDAEREREARRSACHEVRRWAARRGWAMKDEPDPELLGSFDPRRRPGHEVVAAAEGELAGWHTGLLLCTSDGDEGSPAYAVVTLRMPARLPALEVRQRYFPARLWRTQHRVSPDPSAGDRRFHRRLTISRARPACTALLTGPVRGALLSLSQMGCGKWDFVDLRDDTLRVLVARWPPALDLDLLVETVLLLARALLDALDGEELPTAQVADRTTGRELSISEVE
jgi:hypothetical protein